MVSGSDARAPSLADIEALAAEALAAIPEPFHTALTGVVIRVAEFADDETLDAMQIENAFELTGLYRGTALTERSVADWGGLPDEIWLYRRPILDEWAERGDVGLAALVRHVLIHEAAHHFGWSDEDIAAVDDWRL
ncbi:MAG: metallopeptidase family protein [Pseudomonadota bacterium]